MSELSTSRQGTTSSVPATAADPRLPSRVRRALTNPPVSFEIGLPDGAVVPIGEAAPAFRITARTARARTALFSLNELRIAESYLAGETEVDGDMVQLFALRPLLSDRAPLTSMWRFVEPLLFGQLRTNKRAISSHYDIDETFFLSFLDPEEPSYTQGVYESSTETLAAATRRKFDYCFSKLNLKPGDHLLDIGPGWGAWLQYAGARGVKCTGISISGASIDYLRKRAEQLGQPWTLAFSDLLAYAPGTRFDAIAIMGVIEHLPHYDKVLAKFADLVKPGGRIFLDGSAVLKKYDVANFIVKYIYPGNHSYMVLHDFMRAMADTPLRLVELQNDRYSYYLTARQWAINLERNGDAIRRQFGEDAYRRFRLFLWGTAYQFVSRGLDCYRMIIENPG